MPSNRCPGRSGLALLLLGIALSIGAGPTAVFAANPSVRLEGATVPRAKALALDAALLKGWKLARSGRDYAVFETPLDTPASPGPADARACETTLLRIFADFTEANGAVTATLRAEEVWRPFTPRAWSTDITDAYRRNLERALASLCRQWDQYAGTTQQSARSSQQPKARPGAGSDQPQPLDPVTLRPRSPSSAPPTSSSSRSQQPAPTTGPTQPAPAEDRFTREPVGIWAFDAERVARQRGCDLDDRGAVLLSDRAGIERHRVGCVDRGAMIVSCNRQRCWASR